MDLIQHTPGVKHQETGMEMTIGKLLIECNHMVYMFRKIAKEIQKQEPLKIAFVIKTRIAAIPLNLSNPNEIRVEWSVALLLLAQVVDFFFHLHKHANSLSARAMKLIANNYISSIHIVFHLKIIISFVDEI